MALIFNLWLLEKTNGKASGTFGITFLLGLCCASFKYCSQPDCQSMRGLKGKKNGLRLTSRALYWEHESISLSLWGQKFFFDKVFPCRRDVDNLLKRQTIGPLFILAINPPQWTSIILHTWSQSKDGSIPADVRRGHDSREVHHHLEGMACSFSVYL